MVKNGKIIVAFALIAISMLIGIVHAQALPGNIQDPLGTFKQWLPIVSVAILVSLSIAALLYLFGKFLNDSQLSARGISELGQAIGSAVFVVLIISLLLFFGNFMSQSNVITGSLSTDLTNICNGLTGLTNPSNPSKIGFLSSNPTALVCKIVSPSSGGGTSLLLNYGIAASYVITANLTNQAADNLDGLYAYEGYVGFLSTLTSDPGLCEPAPLCATVPLEPRAFSLDLSSVPYKGYGLISSMTRPLETQGAFIFYMMLTQLVITFILINIWPYLLAAGIILRAISFTRRAGGLIMGMMLVVIIILPLLSILEYNVLGHGVSTTQIVGDPSQIQESVIFGMPISTDSTPSFEVDWGDGTGHTIFAPPFLGVSAPLIHRYLIAGTYTIKVTMSSGDLTQQVTVPSFSAPKAPPAGPLPAIYLTDPVINNMDVSICPTGTGGVCTAYYSLAPNFYVFPKISSVVNYNGCLPWGGMAGTSSLGLEEAAELLKMATVGLGAAFSFGGFVGDVPLISALGVGCRPPEVISTALQLMNVYGLMSVVGFMLPLLNILIVISAIKNVSSLFGGDTDIAGLGKLV